MRLVFAQDRARSTRASRRRRTGAARRRGLRPGSRARCRACPAGCVPPAPKVTEKYFGCSCGQFGARDAQLFRAFRRLGREELDAEIRGCPSFFRSKVDKRPRNDAVQDAPPGTPTRSRPPGSRSTRCDTTQNSKRVDDQDEQAQRHQRHRQRQQHQHGADQRIDQAQHQRGDQRGAETVDDGHGMHQVRQRPTGRRH